MKKRFHKIILLLIVVIISSCESIMINEPKVTPTSTFEDLWKQMDERYPHFEIKDVNWKSIHTKYSKRIYDAMPQTELFDVLSQMLGEIKDGHVNLISSFNVSHSPEINEDILGKKNYNEDVIYKSYLTYTYNTTGGIMHKGIKDGKIGYLNYSSWMNSISASNLAYIYSLYRDTEGLILDLRGNTGGAVSNLRTFLKTLPSHGQLLYTTQVKTGPGYDEFGELTPSFAPENGEYPIWNKKMVVLIGPRSYSCSSLCALCLKAYDNVLLIGDKTSGGTSVVYTFTLNNGWEYRTPMSRTFSPDGKNYENGVPPDYYVDLNPIDLVLGIDSIIEEACKIILE